MADWSPSSDPGPYQLEDSNQDCLGFGKSERVSHSANWAMDWLKVLSKNSRYVRLDLQVSSMAGETMCSIWKNDALPYPDLYLDILG